MKARVTKIEEAAAVPAAGGLYQPLRRTLDIRSFGLNAYFAPKAGDQLIEPHDETGSGSGEHAEAYVVITGGARFVVDGEEIDAPAGTVVFVPDTSAKREATATEDRTSAIVIGGPADRELPVSPFEFWFVAEGPYREGDYERAIEIVASGLEHWPEHPVMLYQLACYASLAAIGNVRSTSSSAPVPRLRMRRSGRPTTPISTRSATIRASPRRSIASRTSAVVSRRTRSSPRARRETGAGRRRARLPPRGCPDGRRRARG